MRWTGETIRKLKALAAEGKSRKEAAAEFAVSVTTIASAASRLKVSFHSTLPPLHGDVADIRARWAEMLPGLKENLRRDLNI